MKSKYNITHSADFDNFVQRVFKASRLMSKLDWTFLNGCAFTFAAITTVGYGDISPRTALGQGLTIPFCLIGIPIIMLALKTPGEVVLLGLKTITVAFEKKMLKRCNIRRKLTKCLIVNISGMTILICLLATAETYIDGWTFMEGVYCWFITFTTIGFGDYIPLQEFRSDKIDNSKWVLLATGSLLVIPYVLGLCLVSGLLNLLVEGSDKIKIHFHKVSTVCCTNCKIRHENRENTRESTNNDVKLDVMSSRRYSV